MLGQGRRKERWTVRGRVISHFPRNWSACAARCLQGCLLVTLLIARADSDARHDPSAEQGRFLPAGRALSLLLQLPVQTSSEGSSHKSLYLFAI